MTSPMERTKKVLTDAGIMHQVVERYFPKSKKYPFGCKQDLFNIIDLLALDNGFVGIQVCGTDYLSHIHTLIDEHKASTIEWLKQPGGRIELWGWRPLKKKRGGKAKVWKPRISDIFLVAGELIVEERK